MVEGAKERSRWGIDHVTAPTITSRTRMCFYCTVMPNEIVSCKNTREKQHVLNERASRGDGSIQFGSLINKSLIILYHFH